MIEIKHLRKEYESVTPIEDLSVTINDGDVISLIGPSGTGKSTLIRCINLLERPTSGQVFLDGEEITAKGYDLRKARQKMGMVFQSFNLFGHLTVIENLMIAPMKLLGRSKQEAYDTAMDHLYRVGMAGKALSFPDELSGGQKQRAAIARTLCMDPEVILLDEPTSALDPTMIAEVQDVIRDLSKSGKTMIIVTHEMEFARAISNRVFYMDQGGIYEEGTPDEIFEEPKKELSRRFIRRLKVFETLIDSGEYDFIKLGAELDRYLAGSGAEASDKYRIRLVVEELVQQILLPRFEEPQLRLRVEWSPKEGRCEVYVSYPGPRVDIRDTENELSLKIIEKTVDEISYSYDEDIEEANTVILKFRKD